MRYRRRWIGMIDWGFGDPCSTRSLCPRSTRRPTRPRRSMKSARRWIIARRRRCRNHRGYNNSQDDTADVDRDRCATAIREPVPGIARARNDGAAAAEGDVLVFIDSDVMVPRQAFQRKHQALSDPICIGGTFDVDSRPVRWIEVIHGVVWPLKSPNAARLHENTATDMQIRAAD